MTPDETEERFIALESIIAENERTLKDLNQIVAQQALTIGELIDLPLHSPTLQGVVGEKHTGR